MAEFVRVAAVGDLSPGNAMEAWVNGRAVALCNVDGAFHAVSNACLHRGGPLGRGSLDGRVLLCPWHSWGWDVTSGASDVNPQMRLARYEVKVEDGDVFVRVED
jgi:nitrite reductase/ring-hydroxylating ferredoxin subunit